MANQFKDPLRKKTHFKGFLQGMETLNRRQFFYHHVFYQPIYFYRLHDLYQPIISASLVGADLTMAINSRLSQIPTLQVSSSPVPHTLNLITPAPDIEEMMQAVLNLISKMSDAPTSLLVIYDSNSQYSAVRSVYIMLCCVHSQ